MASLAIEVRDVARVGSAPVRAVDGVDLVVPSGGVMGIVGESGCGKTRWRGSFWGLLAPSRGEVLVEGQRLAALDRRARARLIQPVFQDPYSSLNPRQRVRDIVACRSGRRGSATSRSGSWRCWTASGSRRRWPSGFPAS